MMLQLLRAGRRSANLTRLLSVTAASSHQEGNAALNSRRTVPNAALAAALHDQSANSSLHRPMWLTFAATAAAAVLCTTDAHASSVTSNMPPLPTGDAASNTSEGTHLVSLKEKQRLYFLYEKRIRELSNSEKVFEYFANEKRRDGSAFMRPQDLLAALISVYPPDRERDIRSGSLPGEPTRGIPTATNAEKQVSNFFMQHFDTDGNGLIDFHEYLLIVTLLSIPLKDAEIAFAMLDVDDNGTVDKGEFEALTAVLKQRTRRTAGAGAGRTGFRPELDADDSGLMLHFFGESGQKKLDLAAFNAFLEGLHAEIDRLEYQHYDPQATGYMTGRDFAHSMIASVGLHQIHHYLSQVDSMPDSLTTATVSREGFQTFATLWRNVHSLAVATDLHYNSMGFFRKADFKRAVKKITGRPLEDAQVDIIFSIFDVENDGSLACSEFVGVIKQREGRHGTTTPAIIDEMRDMGLVACLRNCVGL